MANSGQYDPTALNSVTIQPWNTGPGTISGNGMAIPTISSLNQFDLVSLDTYQGEMVTAQITISDNDAIMTGMSASGFHEDVKKRLIHMLAESLMKNRLIEFTSQQFAHSQETTFRARIYAVPDTQVRMIRKNMP